MQLSLNIFVILLILIYNFDFRVILGRNLKEPVRIAGQGRKTWKSIIEKTNLKNL